MYADDTVIIYASYDSRIIENIINKEISQIVGWFQENLLVLNLRKDKIGFILYGTTQRLKGVAVVKIIINGTESLSLSEQFNTIYSKAVKIVHCLLHVRHADNTSSRINLQKYDTAFNYIFIPSNAVFLKATLR